MASLIGRIFGKATSPRIQVGPPSRPSSAQQAAKSPPAPSPRFKSARFGFVRAIADKVVRQQGDVRQRIDTLKQSGDITATTHFILSEMLDKFSPQEVSKFIELELDRKDDAGVRAEKDKVSTRGAEVCEFFIAKREEVLNPKRETMDSFVGRHSGTIPRGGEVHKLLKEGLFQFEADPLTRWAVLDDAALSKQLGEETSSNPNKNFLEKLKTAREKDQKAARKRLEIRVKQGTEISEQVDGLTKEREKQEEARDSQLREQKRLAGIKATYESDIQAAGNDLGKKFDAALRKYVAEERLTAFPATQQAFNSLRSTCTDEEDINIIISIHKEIRKEAVDRRKDFENRSRDFSTKITVPQNHSGYKGSDSARYQQLWKAWKDDGYFAV